MCDTAFEYAARHGLTRTNEIHGEQEAKLVLSEGFNWEEEDLEVRQSCQRLTVKVSCLTHCLSGGACRKCKTVYRHATLKCDSGVTIKHIICNLKIKYT